MKKNYFLIIPLCIMGLYSCRKDNGSVTKPQVVHVYVAGVENNGVFDVAEYWKNGIPVILSDGSSQASANSIIVSDSDVYVAGWVRNSSTQTAVAVYWKNGIAVNLTDGSHDTYATSITVSGNDVYVSGTQYDIDSATKSIAKYWKNGSLTNFSGGSNVATSIAVSGTDVYVAGNSGFYIPGGTVNSGGVGNTGGAGGTGDYGGGAEYWKNGNVVNLGDPAPQEEGYYVFSIVVSGNDVYVAGTWGVRWAQTAIYWKNGNLVELSGGNDTTATTANSIAVAGNDVYVAGSKYRYDTTIYLSNSIAQYWKNGTAVTLTDVSHLGFANSIAVAGNDVYVAGVEYAIEPLNSTGPSIATYWKNGNHVNLTDGSKNAVANSIFISAQ